jgi:hypothetical protein
MKSKIEFSKKLKYEFQEILEYDTNRERYI